MYLIILANNDAEDTGYFSNAGALRLAKAQWWLVARLAGEIGKKLDDNHGVHTLGMPRTPSHF